MPSCAAAKWSLPISTCRTMFSRTTIASSIRMPIANERPRSDIVSSLKPSAHTAMKLASTEIGKATPVITVDRHEFKNTKTTSTVSSAPSNSASSTFSTACVDAHAGILHEIDLGPRRQSLLDLRETIAHAGRDVGRAVAVRLLDVDADCFLAVEQRQRPRLFRPVLDRRDLAESNRADRCGRRRRGCRTPPDSAADRADESRARRALPFTRPTGAARFCACSACTTCATLTFAACSLCGSTSTVSSRSTLPKICTSATPGIARSSRVMPGSASRVSSAGDSTVDDIATDTIGRSVLLNF